MNAAALLDALVGEGVAREKPVPPGGREAGCQRVAAAFGIEIEHTGRTNEKSLGARWKQRVGNSALALLLVADDPEEPGSLLVRGPGRHSPLRGVSAAALLGVLRCSSTRPTVLEAVRELDGGLARLDRATIPGVLVRGLLTPHTLEQRFRKRPECWEAARRAVAGLPARPDWRELAGTLGYRWEQLPVGYRLRAEAKGEVGKGEGKPDGKLEGKVVAMVHPIADPAAFGRADAEGRLPEGRLVEACRDGGARYGLLAARGRFRLFDAESPAAVSEWLELDAESLAPESRPFFALLGPRYLAQDGFAELQQEARDYGVKLWRRLDQRIRRSALPALAAGLDRWAERAGFDIGDEEQRQELEAASRTLLFRLLFLLYAESSGFLPVGNPIYRRKSATGLVHEAGATRERLASRSSALWSSFVILTRAMREGNPAWSVPAYNGALFHRVHLPGAELLEKIELDDFSFARVLLALGHDDEEQRGVDYSTLEIGHLGHLYESLLGLKLSLADRPVRYDQKNDRYLHAGAPGAANGATPKGALLWQTDRGGRKAGGVYYTPALLVRQLVDRAVRPAFRAHLARVEETAQADRAEAARELLRFAVVDPACGSGHFLVAVVDALADETVRFLARVSLPALRERLDRLHPGSGWTGSAGAAPVEDLALLRRVLVKHCVFGVDRSPMGAEIAAVSLWLASFVPGLALSFLGRNVIAGDSLFGVADRDEVIAPHTFAAAGLGKWLELAAAAAAVVAAGEDRTPEEYEASRSADCSAREAVEGLSRVFDLWSAEPFGQPGNRELVTGHGVRIAGGTLDRAGEARIAKARETAERHAFLHWPLAFPAVFHRERPGFDAVVGNPPWEELRVEELSFFGLYLPGIQSAPEHERARAVAELEERRPELRARLESERERVREERTVLRAAGFASTAGDSDLYKCFCRRYRALLREGGFLGVVLPRSAFNAKGSAGFREWLHRETTVRRVDFLLNKGQWAFDMEPRYSVALLAAQRLAPLPGHRIEIAGTAGSEAAWREQTAAPGVALGPAAYGPGRQLPLLRSQAEAGLLEKLRRGTPFPLGPGGVRQDLSLSLSLSLCGRPLAGELCDRGTSR